MLFPSVSVPGELTRIALSDVHAGDDLPNVNALLSTDDPTAYADAPESTPRAVPLLTEHALNTFTRPGLRVSALQSMMPRMKPVLRTSRL